MNKTGEDIFVIPGTRKEKYLLDNFGGGAVQLSKEDLAEVRKVAESFKVSGNRYPDAMMASVNV
jgi:aryl-alcohol dehydrogenase-like predicted oxidoreductase